MSKHTQKANIEWAEKTWNPITGCMGPKLSDGEYQFTDENGDHQCPGCYAKSMANRLKGRAGYPEVDPFTPTFHENRLHQPSAIKTSKLFFTFSMADWLDDGVKDEWRELVLNEMAKNPRHRFITLTKQYSNLEKLNELILPKNLWVGISVNYADQMWGLEKLRELEGPTVKFASFEPLMEEAVSYSPLPGLDWIIIGARTRQGKYSAFQPKKEWVMRIIDTARTMEIPVFLKPNLDYIRKGWFDHPIEGMPLDYHVWATMGEVKRKQMELK